MERSCEPIDKNRIEGEAEQGERACNREALVIKAQAAWIRRLCSEGVRSYLGRSRLASERATVSNWSEKSAEVVVAGVAGLKRPEVKRRRTEREQVLSEMSMSEAMHQMPARAGRAGDARGEAVRQPASDEAEGPRHEATDTGSALLQAALTRDNLQRALKWVRANKGAAAVDGLDIDQTVEHLVTAWPGIREQLLRGEYRPSPLRRVEIPQA